MIEITKTWEYRGERAEVSAEKDMEEQNKGRHEEIPAD